MLKESPLGKEAPYISRYTPSLLFPVPRTMARDRIGLRAPLPFSGSDIWTGYELSWLNPKGKPQVAMADILVPCTSLHIIESKSLKLYLNSFNQSYYDSAAEVHRILERDLSQCAVGEVRVTLMAPQIKIGLPLVDFSGVCLDDLEIETDQYEVQPAFLKASDRQVAESLHTHLLKSNCLATGQPDWGSLCIRYRGPQIDREGLLKYIVSYRNHSGFHEDCVERMFFDLSERCRPTCLTVYARYTRRGGLDINPFRSNYESVPDNERHVRQ